MRRALATFCLPLLLSAAASGQSTTPAPAFDKAEVHSSKSPATPSNPPSEGGAPQDVQISLGRFNVTGVTLTRLIAMAYGVPDSAVVGGAKWLETERFDVTAQTEPTATFATVQPMRRTLLATSFHLAVHSDNRPVRVYALTVLKRGPKLTQSHGAGLSRCEKSVVPTLQAGGGRGVATVLNLTFACHNTSMAQLADRLPSAAYEDLAYPVVDLTGLTGAYDFVLGWTGTRRMGPAIQRDLSGPSVFDSLKDLGLQLAAQQRPTPVLVVDHADRPPAH